MTPEGPPDRQPPCIMHRSCGLMRNPRSNARPESGPIWFGHDSRDVDDQMPEPPNQIGPGRAVRTGPQMRLEEPRGAGSQSPIDMAFHSRTSPETGESWHGRYRILT